MFVKWKLKKFSKKIDALEAQREVINLGKSSSRTEEKWKENVLCFKEDFFVFLKDNHMEKIITSNVNTLKKVYSINLFNNVFNELYSTFSLTKRFFHAIEFILPINVQEKEHIYFYLLCVLKQKDRILLDFFKHLIGKDLFKEVWKNFEYQNWTLIKSYSTWQGLELDNNFHEDFLTLEGYKAFDESLCLFRKKSLFKRSFSLIYYVFYRFWKWILGIISAVIVGIIVEHCSSVSEKIFAYFSFLHF